SVLSSDYFLRFLRSDGKQYFKTYLIFTAFLPFIHLVGFLIYIVQSFYVLTHVRQKRLLICSLAVHVLCVIFYLPVMLIILRRYNYWEDLPKIYSWVHLPQVSRLWDWMILSSGSHLAYLIQVFV